MRNFNFFKVHPIIVVNLVAEYIKNEVQLKPDTLYAFEHDLKIALNQKSKNIIEESELIPDEILVHERFSAQLFQSMMKKYGV